MFPSCPHCGDRVAATSILWSATGVGRSFGCPRCSRRLSVSGGWKIAYTGILALAVVACCLYDFEKGDYRPFLGLPVFAAFASLVVWRMGRVRLYHPDRVWMSALNYGIIGLSLCALSIAYTQ